MARTSDADILRDALEEQELPAGEAKPEPHLPNASPLQVLESIAVNGKSETARVQALKVLLDRQHQLERERELGHPTETCAGCRERARHWAPDPEAAARALEELFDLGVLLPRLLQDALTKGDGDDRLAEWIRDEVLGDVRSVEAEIERRAQERVRTLLSVKEGQASM